MKPIKMMIIAVLFAGCAPHDPDWKEAQARADVVRTRMLDNNMCVILPPGGEQALHDILTDEIWGAMRYAEGSTSD